MLACQKHLFSLPVDLHYLNCAYMAPLAKPVEEAGLAGVLRKRDPTSITPESFFSESDVLRERFARLVGAGDPERVAILAAVSYGMAIVARNTKLSRGQNVVVLAEQFPSNYYAWSRLCHESGGELRVVAAPDSARRGAAWNEALLRAIDSATVLVAMPRAHWADGTLFDLDAVRARTREVGAALAIDGTQTVGALPLDVGSLEPDALVCAGYKTLHGPYGIALGWFGARYDGGSPLEDNWAPRVGSEDFAGLVDYSEGYRPKALRYDVGERSNFVAVPMMTAALDLVWEWTPAAVQEYCRRLTEEPLREIAELGYRIEEPSFRGSHLFGIRPPRDVDPGGLRTALAARRVAVSLRGDAVRVSPSVYNRPEDLVALREVLRAARPRHRSVALAAGAGT
jgi:selenocysteine lyase/cysteine desulfurase